MFRVSGIVKINGHTHFLSINYKKKIYETLCYMHHITGTELYNRYNRVLLITTKSIGCIHTDES